ncbi:hypothetical protein [Gracilimonas sediminicola]|uniref:Uncharacterized protein n=1 Tax=Gracilimonas sediminicola TaxID=2952158 RepID=A0A9X2L1X6_9BACT|nr:hypothetical protein [Gracilimonas sediminicola]MCP9290568.1 hypothetical protein [Gracilimonas sediminicola]
MNDRIVILGWGSLIYEPRELSEQIIGTWIEDGPKLPIEFSRVSSSRKKALTLVIDPDNGSKIKTSYIISKREKIKDCVEDLRKREGTSINRIGVIDLKDRYEKRFKYPKVAEKIQDWAEHKNIATVVWTDLPSNFAEESNNEETFSVENAIKHLNSLKPDGLLEAKKYIKKAPRFVATPLRAKLNSTNWVDQ